LARALADVPPKIDGDTLLLAVEVRWPATQVSAPATVGSDEAFVNLHSVPHFSRTVRATERGPLWMEDARQVDGRWVVPGAVEVFTSRGTRMLTVHTGEKDVQGFEVPLPAFPSAKNLEWSDWLPKYRAGASIAANALSFRFRAVKASLPVRTETIGPFAVATIANSFYQVQHDERTLNAAFGQFAVRYRGKPLVIDVKFDRQSDSTERTDRFDGVALLSGPRPGILVSAGAFRGTGRCYVVTENGDSPSVEDLADCGIETLGDQLTSDSSQFHGASKRKAVRGRIDRTSYAQPGLFHFLGAVLDTRQLVVRRFGSDTTINNNVYLAPFALSPDERSFVTYATTDDSARAPLLVVTDFIANRTYTLPIDPARMRYATLESLDPTWVNHHFVWQRGRDGSDRLVVRGGFVPIPYRGEVSVEKDGYRTYRIEKGTEGLRRAVIEFLVNEFNAVRQPADSGAYDVPVKIDGRVVNVAFSSSPNYVSVSFDRRDAGNPALITEIAKRFDAALATGRYDSLFTN
jgi:hypothetical protein